MLISKENIAVSHNLICHTDLFVVQHDSTTPLPHSNAILGLNLLRGVCIFSLCLRWGQCHM